MSHTLHGNTLFFKEKLLQDKRRVGGFGVALLFLAFCQTRGLLLNAKGPFAFFVCHLLCTDEIANFIHSMHCSFIPMVVKRLEFVQIAGKTRYHIILIQKQTDILR